jgi:hypothetical protein
VGTAVARADFVSVASGATVGSPPPLEQAANSKMVILITKMVKYFIGFLRFENKT